MKKNWKEFLIYCSGTSIELQEDTFSYAYGAWRAYWDNDIIQLPPVGDFLIKKYGGAEKIALFKPKMKKKED